MKTSTNINWCIDQHKATNHMYDKYLPYEFHLRMVTQAFKDFRHLLPTNLYIGETRYMEDFDETLAVIEMSCWAHDLIEDTRTSYNDVRNVLGYSVAEIVYAVSNEKGKNRKERANEKYYEGIRNVPGAVFVKLCDRIANIQYSKMTKSRMFDAYKKENPGFIEALGFTETHELKPMFDYIENLFTETN